MSRFCLLAAAIVLGSWARTAAAQEPPDAPDDAEETAEGAEPAALTPPPRPKTDERDDDEDASEPPLVLPAPDMLSGHIMISPSFGYAVPFANLEADAPQSDVMSSGWAAGLDAAYGLSRTVAVGAWGQYLSLGSSDPCKDCKTKSTAFGAFVRYHLVQGTRFDPWMAAGLGYRMTTISGLGQDVKYSGIEWLRLVVGGDWYAFNAVGFGPYLELDMGRYGTRSPGSLGDSANHWHFLMGARVTLDVPGK
jgi:hypothetical protein